MRWGWYYNLFIFCKFLIAKKKWQTEKIMINFLPQGFPQFVQDTTLSRRVKSICRFWIEGILKKYTNSNLRKFFFYFDGFPYAFLYFYQLENKCWGRKSSFSCRYIWNEIFQSAGSSDWINRKKWFRWFFFLLTLDFI